MELVGLVAASYLLGAIPFAVLVPRAMGLPDPRRYGSRNPGTTNVARAGNRVAPILTLFADAGKGAAAVLLARHFWETPAGGGIAGVAAETLAGVAAVAGHIFSVFLKFRGGKGVAVALGVFAAVDWKIGLATAGIWAGTFALTRYSSVASLVTIVGGGATFIFAGADGSPETPAGGDFAWVAASVGGIVALVIFRHSRNIADLLRGKERRFSESSVQLTEDGESRKARSGGGSGEGDGSDSGDRSDSGNPDDSRS